MHALSIGQIQILLHGTFLGIFLVLGHVFSRQYQAFFRRDLWVNIGTGLGILLLLKPLMGWLKEALTFHLFSLEGLHPALQFGLAFLMLDFLRYWLHFMHHRVPFFWKFHRVHHSSATLDSTSGLRMHLFDFVQLGLLPILLFSSIFDIRSWSDWMLPSVLLVGTFFDAFQHSNIRFDIQGGIGKAWHRLFNNPHFHAWHHVRDVEGQDGNYGNVLVLWDRLFRTEVTQENLPETLGLNKQQALQTKDPFSLQLLRRPQP